MNFIRLVPNVYYRDIKDGLKIFIDCLGFKIGYEELTAAKPFCVIEKNGLQIYLFQHDELARQHYPEFRFQTNDVDEVYRNVSSSHPEYLHPNLNSVTLRPWGAKEFAVRDSQICIIIQQW